MLSYKHIFVAMIILISANMIAADPPLPKKSRQLAIDVKLYNFFDPKFREFIATLGLKTYTVEDKRAFISLKKETKACGW
jgi:hypothetical protein